MKAAHITKYGLGRNFQTVGVDAPVPRANEVRYAEYAGLPARSVRRLPAPISVFGER